MQSQNNVNQEPIKMYSSKGIDVYKISTDKYKTNTINIFIHDNLTADNASKNALIPAVLRRGTRTLNTSREISICLEELYGATFDCGVSKKGEQQILQYYIEYINDFYTGDNSNLFEKSFNFLLEVVTNPYLENGQFKQEYLEQEKFNIKTLIESKINDKVSYSLERCFEEMCQDEPFGIYDYGKVSDLEKISNTDLFDHYTSLLESNPISIYITGNIQDSKINNIIKKLSSLNRSKIKDIIKPQIERHIPEVRNITETLSINQGKLCLGFRTNVFPDSKEYYSLLVFNGVLGGGVHSKLFMNVREKEGLAYYVFSRLEKFKGLMLIGSGIDCDKKIRLLIFV